ncbi:MAG: alpha-2-macroglobulin domain protein [Proteobacteria bacterium]|nr:alpha-2-macroglobulin domain protein [Pseudomonadota bacterium]
MSLIKRLLSVFPWLFNLLFGSFAWSPPAWLRAIGRGVCWLWSWCKSRPRFSGAMLVLALVLGIGGWQGYRWWQAQPKPKTVTFTVEAPALTDYENAGTPNPLVLQFSDSVAPLALVGKVVESGIAITPALTGQWRWRDDKTLEFKPKQDWPVGGAYKGTLAKSLFSPATRLEEHDFAFATAAFEVKVSKFEFYQDPINPGIKQGVFEVHFSHPVNAADFEKRIRLQVAGQSEGVLGVGRETTPFTVSYDKLRLNAYIRSQSLPIPKEDTQLALTLDAGVVATTGGAATPKEIIQKVRVPGLYSLGVDVVGIKVVTNERNDPEHVLVLQSSMAVHERDVGKSVSVWLLPLHHPKKEKNPANGAPYGWNSVSEITPEVLAAGEKLNPEAIPAEREITESHAFKLRADVGRSIYVQVDKGVRAFGGYLLGKNVAGNLRVPPYPAELKILSQGSLLALSGEKKVAVLVRDLPGIRFDIGRILPGQLQHMVSQSGGAFGDPKFWGSFGPDNLVERFDKKVPMRLQRGKAHYESLDLGEYLKMGGEDRRGVFFLNVQSYDPRQDKSVAKPWGEGGPPQYQPPYASKSDKRLIVITDLGLLAKRWADGSQDVFVQSIHTGQPVAGATVEVLGKNGQALMSQVTDNSGRVHFPKLEGFGREKTPVLYIVKKGGDMSFLPLGRSDRGLDYSRFDVGGIDNASSADQLNAYLFSDRGMYRPGEEIHIGMIVRAADWAKKLEGLPLEAEVVDSRGLSVRREKLKMGAGGFSELSHQTTETSPTGTYTVNLYIVKDGKTGQQIGSTTVRVQEFLPDRMKVVAHLSKEADEGWVHPKELSGRVNVQNLFGTPAQKRRVEATLTLSPAFASFRSYPDHVFYDPYRAKEGYTAKLEAATSDDQGNAEFALGLEKYARATYRLHFLARAFEAEGGRAVAAEASVLVSEQPYMIGYKPDGALNSVARGSKRSVNLIALNPEAKKQAVSGLQLQLRERRTVSVLIRQNNGSYKYESRQKEVLVKETPLNIAAGGQALALENDTPGDFVYVIRNAEGLELNRVEYSVTGVGNVTRSLERNAELQMTLSKKDYKPGEEIEISIRAPYVGAGLITIEREKVFAQQWFKTTTTASVQKITLPKDFEGNGYISVQFIRDPGSDEIFTSPLSYGVMPFVTNLSQRINTLALTTPALVKPGQNAQFKLTAKTPTRAVIFAVDEGILQVARYKLPDPLGHFFQKRRLEVTTAQILDLILPEFKKLMQAAAPGGDAEGALGKHLNPFKRKRDKPAVFWSGIIDVKDSATVTMTVPETFNGALRVMAVTVNDDMVGVIEKQTLVRGDFVLTPNTPLVVAPGDEFEVSVGVANNVKGSGNKPAVTVGLKPSPHFELIGQPTQQLNIGEMRESVALFRLKVKNGADVRLGSGSLVFTASLGGKSGKLSTDISVRPATPHNTVVRVGSFKGSAEVPVQRELHGEFRQTEAALSPLPLAVVGGLTTYLDNFGHLCTEQLVSQAMAPMVLARRPEFAAKTAKPGNKGIAEAIRVLRTRQNAEGGFGLWEASVNAHEFASVHAAHFLIEARERGEAVPPDMTQKSLDYLAQLAASQPESLYGARIRAQAIYLLTRSGSVTTALLSSLREHLEARHGKVWRTDLTAAYLAASYQLLKQEKPAAELMAPLADKIGEKQAEFRHDSYYDPLVRDTQVLFLLARHFPERARKLPPQAMIGMMKPIEEGRFNTLSAAFTVLALDAYASSLGDASLFKMAIAEIDRNGKKQPLTLPPHTLVARVPFSPAAAKLGFTGEGDRPYYYAVTEAGFDRAPPTTELKDGLEIFREYLDDKGNPVKTAKLGDELTVRIRLRGINRAVNNVAVVDLLPGALEAIIQPTPEKANDESNSENSESNNENSESEEGEDSQAKAKPQNDEQKPADRLGGKGSWQTEFIDVREDRVVLYGSVGRDLAEYSYKVKVVAAGTFVVPPAYAESMYERSIKARSAAGSITVERKGK